MISKIKYTIIQIYESIAFALESVVVNKMRTFLSLLGITIGIFAIISVYTAIDTLEGYVRNSLDAISKSAVQIGKWPWGPEEGDNGEYKWWKFLNRPEVKEVELEELIAMTPGVKQSALAVYINRSLKYDGASYNPSSIVGSTDNYRAIRASTEIENGRYFTPFEFETGANNAIIGATIVEELFQGENPVGKTMKIGNKKVEIIGTFKKEGQSMIGASWDDQVFIPLKFAKTLTPARYANPEMYLIGADSIAIADFKEQVSANMRQIRRLSPSVENNFTVNDVGTVTKELDSVFSIINLAGGIIGIFSILVGGFGIANIMFVSVRERTTQIGIQKALGARAYFIMLQFTFEAVLLSVVGGIVGLSLIWVLTIIVSQLVDFNVVLSFQNIVIGLGISSIVGAISGIFPAYSAATMDPVKAISKN